MKLQFELWTLVRKNKLEINTYSKVATRDIDSIISQMRQEYFSDNVTLCKDINYAITTAAWVCKSVSCFLDASPEPVLERELEVYPVFSLEGGRK